ncbi:MAG: universal stress protein [Nocardioidaceae bacterium]
MTGTIQNTVVVGVDGTEDGERALRYALSLVEREGLDLRIVHVAHEYQMYAPMLPYLPEPQLLQIGEAVLEDARRLAEAAGVGAGRTGSVLAHGPRTSALLSHTHDARAVVLGTRSSVLGHLVTGSTSVSIAAHADAPVHCVPRGWTTEGPAHTRIVAGLDGSAADADVLAEAFREGDARRADVRLVHAWRPVSPYDSAIMGRTLRGDWEESARDALLKRVEEAAAGHAGIEWDLDLRFERVPVALHEAAAEADLLVLGRHGHLLPAALLVGSNTRTLLRTATCPVVVVPIAAHHDR